MSLNNQPCIDPTLGNQAAQEASGRISNLAFTQELHCDFGNIDNFNNVAATGPANTDFPDVPNSGDLPLSIGQFDIDGEGTMRDVFKVEPLTDGVYGTQHRRPENAESGRRDYAWHNKEYGSIFSSSDTFIEQGGAVIDSENDNYFDFNGDDFNLCTSWLDTFSISREFPATNDGINIPNPATPNVTFGRNTFFELEVNFSNMNTEGFRHSWWLMPATINDQPDVPVLFNDNELRDAAGNPRVLNNTAYDGPGENARNGVEIDIYEHEVGNGDDFDNTLFMKVISADTNAGNTVNTFGTPVNVVSDGINEGWHRIGFLWHETELVWFVDGEAVVRDSENMPNDARMYMLFTRELNDVLITGSDPRSPASRASIPNDSTQIRSLRVWSVADEVANTGRPAAPANVTAVEQSATSIAVSWNAVGGADKYNINRNGGYLTTVTGVTSFTDTGLTSGETYSYTIVSIDEDQTGDDQFSVQSAPPVSVTLGSGGGATGRPAAPANVTAVEQSATSIAVSWNAVGGADKYNINRNGGYLTTVTGVTSFTDTGLTSGETYSYTIVSIDEDQTGDDQFSVQSAPPVSVTI